MDDESTPPGFPVAFCLDATNGVLAVVRNNDDTWTFALCDENGVVSKIPNLLGSSPVPRITSCGNVIATMHDDDDSLSVSLFSGLGHLYTCQITEACVKTSTVRVLPETQSVIIGSPKKISVIRGVHDTDEKKGATFHVRTDGVKCGFEHYDYAQGRIWMIGYNANGDYSVASATNNGPRYTDDSFQHPQEAGDEWSYIIPLSIMADANATLKKPQALLLYNNVNDTDLIVYLAVLESDTQGVITFMPAKNRNFGKFSDIHEGSGGVTLLETIDDDGKTMATLFRRQSDGVDVQHIDGKFMVGNVLADITSVGDTHIAMTFIKDEHVTSSLIDMRTRDVVEAYHGDINSEVGCKGIVDFSAAFFYKTPWLGFFTGLGSKDEHHIRIKYTKNFVMNLFETFNHLTAESAAALAKCMMFSGENTRLKKQIESLDKAVDVSKRVVKSVTRMMSEEEAKHGETKAKLSEYVARELFAESEITKKPTPPREMIKLQEEIKRLHKAASMADKMIRTLTSDNQALVRENESLAERLDRTEDERDALRDSNIKRSDDEDSDHAQIRAIRKAYAELKSLKLQAETRMERMERGIQAQRLRHAEKMEAMEKKHAEAIEAMEKKHAEAMEAMEKKHAVAMEAMEKKHVAIEPQADLASAKKQLARYKSMHGVYERQKKVYEGVGSLMTEVERLKFLLSSTVEQNEHMSIALSRFTVGLPDGTTWQKAYEMFTAGAAIAADIERKRFELFHDVSVPTHPIIMRTCEAVRRRGSACANDSECEAFFETISRAIPE